VARLYPEYKDEVRKKVIVVAHDIFHEKGYHDTKVSDIAVALGVTKPTIYHYFTGKEDLFAAVAEYERKLLEDMIIRVFRGRDFLSGAEVFFDTIITDHLEKIGPESIAITTRDEKMKKIINQDRDQFLAIVAGFLHERKKNGEIREDVDVHSLACALNALFHGLLIYIMQGMDTDEVKRVWIESVRAITQPVSIAVTNDTHIVPRAR
jgi:AcrR family transcriptional regulator